MTKNEELLQLLGEGNLTPEQASVLIKPDSFRLRLTEKGTVEIHLPNRIVPIDLYPSQWERLLEREKDIKSFIREKRRQIEDIAAQRLTKRRHQ